MIRVLLVTSAFPPRLYGGGEITAYLIAQTVGMSADVKVLTLDAATKPSTAITVVPMDRADSIDVIKQQSKTIARLIGDCDMVLHTNMDFYPLMYDIATSHGKRFVLYVNNYSRLFDPSGLGEGGTLAYSKEYLGEILQNMTVCSPTQHLRGLLLSRHGIHAQVLPPPAEEVFWAREGRPWAAGNSLELAFVGHGAIVKNSAILPDVLAGLQGRGINARIRIYEQPGTAKAPETKSIKYRRSYGWAERAAFVADLAQCHILLHPMQGYETFGRAVLEATQLGLPVVSTRCGGPQETLGSHGFFFDLNGGPEGICDCLDIAAQESSALSQRTLRIETSRRFAQSELRAIYARFLSSM